MTTDIERYRASANHLVRDPDEPTVLIDHFSVISEDRSKARYYLPLAKRAYELSPDDLNIIFNYASALHRVGEFERALTLYQRCVKMAKALENDDSDWLGASLHHVGIAYRSLNENEKAAEFYLKAYEVNGDLKILKDRGLAMMAGGDLLEGLKQHEVRKKIAEEKHKANGGKLILQAKLPDDVVHWHGEDLTGKTVVVFHEEGVGDFIQWCRFIPRLRTYGAEKILLTSRTPDIIDLVADNIPVDGTVPLAGPFECDYVAGSLTVPWRTGVTYKDVSGKPYFKTEPAALPRRGKLNVGLVWRGNPGYGQDSLRSMPFTELTPLFDLPGVAFHSLQAGPAGLEVGELGLDGFVANLEPFCSTWRNTAKVIQALDVVVSVDTACAHLAGALGKPVYILVTKSCDWRWNRNTRKTVWYDSAQVIRQKVQGDWAPCIKAVRDELKGMLGVRRQAA